MTWLWQLEHWPQFTWDATALTALEIKFLTGSGRLAGAWQHLSRDDQTDLRNTWLSDEALKTSAIEGEFLDRASVQSSVRRQFGLTADRRSGPREAGIAELLVTVYQDFDQPISMAMIKKWHAMVMNGRRDIDVIGDWRKHADPMQVVSGADYQRKVHFEAPPSHDMTAEMANFIQWFLHSQDVPALTRAGIAHFYFVCVHPFEDGNGRIARALAEKSLAETLGHPSLIALNQRIAQKQKGYYDVLEASNRNLDITAWLVWFAETAVEAQVFSEHQLTRLIDKTKMMDALRGQLNERQEKALLRMFRAEPTGFEGGLSAANYSQITGAHGATVTRDLADLIAKGALRKTGARRYTRYFLNLPTLD